MSSQLILTTQNLKDMYTLSQLSPGSKKTIEGVRMRYTDADGKEVEQERDDFVIPCTAITGGVALDYPRPKSDLPRSAEDRA